MPALRGHHLICLQFFRGEGYRREFIENLAAVLNEARAGSVVIAAGADDVCRVCPHLVHGDCRYREGADEAIREMDRTALTLLGRFPGDAVRWEEVRAMLPAMFSQWFSNYCTECDWRSTCEKDEYYRLVRCARETT